VRRAALVALVLAAVALPVAAFAGAVAPQTGNYVGPGKSNGLPIPVSAKVKKKGSKATVTVKMQADYTCTGGGNYPVTAEYAAPVSGASFSAAGSGTDSFYGKYTYRLKGKFTDAVTIEGTLVREGEAAVGGPEPPPHCTTGTVSFELHRKK
jgi:hypothetical protein